MLGGVAPVGVCCLASKASHVTEGGSTATTLGVTVAGETVTRSSGSSHGGVTAAAEKKGRHRNTGDGQFMIHRLKKTLFVMNITFTENGN